MKKKQQSAAMKLVMLVWESRMDDTGFSWTRVNQGMSMAVKLAIHCGMEFHKTDFGTMSAELRMGRWCGADLGEQWYTQAIETNHASAIASYEEWRKRKPFLVQPSPDNENRMRLHVGARFEWYCKKIRHFVTVTSFAKDQSFVTACTYKPYEKSERCKTCSQEKYVYSPQKIDKRFKITHDNIRAYHAVIREAKKEQSAKEPTGAV